MNADWPIAPSGDYSMRPLVAAKQTQKVAAGSQRKT
jgi:hypothetical protein